MLDEDRYLIFFNAMNWRIIKSVKMKVMTVEISKGVCVCVEVQSLNHWMAREVPKLILVVGTFQFLVVMGWGP